MLEVNANGQYYGAQPDPACDEAHVTHSIIIRGRASPTQRPRMTMADAERHVVSKVSNGTIMSASTPWSGNRWPEMIT
jgi:hypothetical protein